MAATMRVLCTYLSLCSTLCGFGGLAIPTDYGPRHISTDSIPQSSNGSLTYGPHYAGDESLPTQLAKRALLEQRCSGRDARLLASALIDAQQMLEQMIQRSEELVEWLSDFPDEAPDDEELWSALSTFEAIFGQVWGDERITEEGIDDVEAQIEAARLLLEAINPAGSGAPPTVEFYCDHRQWTIHQDGKLYWDRRPLEKRGQRDIVFWHVCRADPEGMVAFTTHFNWEEGEESDGPIQNEVITFCPEALQGFVEEPLRTYRRRILADDETHLDILASERMAVNLVHELSHLDTVLGGLRFTDVEYPDGPNGKAYGFEGIQYLDSGDSQNNAESFAYFVTAMFLNNNDFHKGWSSMF